MRDPELRRERKKYIMPAYAGRGTNAFEEGTDRALTDWIDLIERKYLSTADKCVFMDLEEKTHFYALDAIGEIAFDQSFGCLKQDRETQGVLAINDAIVPILMAVGNYVAFWRIVRMWPFYLLLPNDGAETGFGAIVGQAGKIIAERLKTGAPPKRDMLQSFIAQGLRGEPLKQEVGIQFFAGSDTVASLLYTTLYLLLTHPACYARRQAELNAAYASGTICSSSVSSFAPCSTTTATGPTAATGRGNIIRDAEARTLPYLQAVIREGLRLFPPLTAPPLFKEVPARRGDADLYGGHALPPGTLVATGHAMWHHCREKSFWGEDADSFRPERWLARDHHGDEVDGEQQGQQKQQQQQQREGLLLLTKERLEQMNRRVELAFGAGQFVCVGRGIAMVEVNKVLSELMRRYNWSLAKPLDPPRIQNNGVWAIRNFWVRVEKR